MIRPPVEHRALAGRRRSFTLVELLVAIGIILVLVALTVTATLALTQRSEVRETENLLKLLDVALQEWEQETDRSLTWGVPGVPFSGAKFEMENDTPHVFTTTELLRAIRKSGRVKPILTRIDEKYLYTYDSTNPVVPPWLPSVPDIQDPDPYIIGVGNPRSEFTAGDWDGELALLDAWGTPIRAVHPGSVFSDVQRFAEQFGVSFTVTEDEDGSVHVDDKSIGGTNLYETEMHYGIATNRHVLFVSAGPDRKFGSLAAAVTDELHEQAHDNVYSYPIEDEHE